MKELKVQLTMEEFIEVSNTLFYDLTVTDKNTLISFVRKSRKKQNETPFSFKVIFSYLFDSQK